MSELSCKDFAHTCNALVEHVDPNRQGLRATGVCAGSSLRPMSPPGLVQSANRRAEVALIDVLQKCGTDVFANVTDFANVTVCTRWPRRGLVPPEEMCATGELCVRDNEPRKRTFDASHLIPAKRETAVIARGRRLQAMPN